MTAVLELRHLYFSYENQNVLSDINLSLDAKTSLGIVGPNGGGKTTLLKIIIGFLQPTSGEIIRRFDQQVGYVPQYNSLNDLMPINVEQMIKLNMNKKDDSVFDFSKLIQLVGLTGKEKLLVRHLSGGEKQRALIARSLINMPKLLVLDEPSTGLDSNGQDQLYSLLNEIKNKLETAVIIVDHNLTQILKNCDKILCLNKTQHWHDEKHTLTNDILSSIYHCEFEHILIHEKGTPEDPHTHCDHDHHHQHDHSLLRPPRK